ncbi:peptidylprolyl isomerase [Caminibacter sp.]
MIEWMQKHRRWLVITIWVATIAFIGAGFVGWGQFQFGKSGNNVAKVGNTEVTIKDWQQAYNQIFQQFNNAMGGKLDEATAEKLGLKKLALQKAIQNAILREYAKNLDLMVTDDDVAKKILEYFKNKKTYMTYLRNTGQNAKDFETQLRKQILVEKLLNFLHIKPSTTELLTIASALYNADNLNIKILNKENIKISLSEEEIKKFWEKNKNKYLTPEKYKIAYVEIPLDENISDDVLKNYYEENKINYKNSNGEIMSFEKAKNFVKKDYLAHKLRKEAIIAYKNLKNSKGTFLIRTVTFNNDIIPETQMQTLIKEGYIKPFINNNAYITAKLLEEIKPKPLTFAQAKPQVIEDLLKIKSTQALIAQAKKLVNNFNGENIGFVTKFDPQKIKSLPINLAQQFLFREFSKQKPNGYVLLPSEKSPQYAVLYKILAQKLLDKQKYEKNKQYIYNLSEALVNTEFLESLLNELSQKYTISVYVKD